MVPLVLVAVGSNLPSPPYMSPQAVCEAALGSLSAAGLSVVKRSDWFESEPVPVSAQPWYVNGVVSLGATPDPVALMTLLHATETRFSRTRGIPNAARTLDLDLLAFGNRVSSGQDGPVLPHPRLHLRGFVLLPLAQVAPGWRHPSLGSTVEEMIADLPAGQHARSLAGH